MSIATERPAGPALVESRPVQPLEGKARARRTDAIVNDLRGALGDADAHELIRQLIETNAAVARSMASRYRNRGIDLDDLEQVALLGLTKAAQRFDPGAGHDFLSFAVPTIRGELRRHFRDSGWMVRPPRRVQDLQTRIAGAKEELESMHGRSPRPSEIAEHLGEHPDSVVEALAADGCFTPTSLDAPVSDGSSTLGDLLGAEDRAIARAEARLMLEPLMGVLTARDRRIVRLRYFQEQTQQEIADAVGLTQAQVSRVLTRILADLRAGLVDYSPAA
ncbi:sigma-70 family RNA polymerase sigma factor [Nocardioides sp. zg-1228]|uniref:sigma-70 family RNA polymerase sigma factor n=1 Tax=Nocardioides sp. zg-1228 TaxID=2763008 RepID=UPI00164325FB|nr:sigma-70 family RNA polymerase sigma factor [Nocardioides sp. zg-1228]MBC2932550.1 sigma-70 family RNA polymerase sigma factor [Nocardioides sp. zg-1228]QSF58048.1 sigma-70 family RNA polymerase sigma factor [Nocardioides sp. zg-1228]